MCLLDSALLWILCLVPIISPSLCSTMDLQIRDFHHMHDCKVFFSGKLLELVGKQSFNWTHGYWHLKICLLKYDKVTYVVSYKYLKTKSSCISLFSCLILYIATPKCFRSICKPFASNNRQKMHLKSVQFASWDSS